MRKGIDWRRCRHQGRQRESKYRPGLVLQNGDVITAPAKDDLARRAGQAMREWSRKLGPRDRELFK